MKLHYFIFILNSINQTVATLRVLGGRDSLKDEFPFAVRLEILIIRQDIKEYFRFCTGTAIRSTWILTAGHCYFKELDHPKVKSFARYNSYFPKFLGQISPLLEFLRHPSYSKLLYENVENDLALFRCEKLSVASYAKISAVDYRSFVGHEALVLGFGSTNASALEKPLQVLKGMLNKCLTNDVETKHMMCLVPSCGLVATICGGDSGGAVLHPSGVVGVNSMSLDDCDENTKTLSRTPGSSASIIAMVSPNLNWIVNIISYKNNANVKFNAF
ncbi:unnamed protein product, partial [Brenthis ino]